MPENSYGTILYKRYLVYNYGRQDILCEPYIVQKNDYVIKVFEQKGEISHADFPEFLKIFSKINPEIPDINTIHPGQRLFIPLKKIGRGTYPDQASGIIEIPFVTASSVESMIKANTTTYTVQKGDYVSKIISDMYGKYGSQTYKEGVKLFKIVNPGIRDLNLVYPGQKLKVPDSSLQKQPWYYAVLQDQKAIVADKPDKKKTTKVTLPDTHSESAIDHKNQGSDTRRPFTEAATLLEAKLINRGSYYFPGPNNSDFRVNLAFHPVFQFNDGKRILVYEKGALSEAQKKIINQYWKALYWGELPLKPTFEEIVETIFANVDGLGSKTHYGIKDHAMITKLRSKWSFEKQVKHNGDSRAYRVQLFLLDNKNEKVLSGFTDYVKTKHILVKNILHGRDISDTPKNPADTPIAEVRPRSHKSFITDIFPLMGFSYQPNVSITFGYAGSDIKARSNLMKNPAGEDILIDYGDLYGDAIYAIEKSGLRVITVNPRDYLRKTALNILDAMKVQYELNPVIRKSLSKDKQYYSINIPGILVKKSMTEKYLITTAPIPQHLAAMLKQEAITVIRLNLSK